MNESRRYDVRRKEKQTGACVDVIKDETREKAVGHRGEGFDVDSVDLDSELRIFNLIRFVTAGQIRKAIGQLLTKRAPRIFLTDKKRLAPALFLRYIYGNISGPVAFEANRNVVFVGSTVRFPICVARLRGV